MAMKPETKKAAATMLLNFSLMFVAALLGSAAHSKWSERKATPNTPKAGG